MNPVFTGLCVVHVIIWAFILFAFLNPRAATINLFYVIPFVYIIHIFPFHFLNSMKESMYPDDWEKRVDTVVSHMVIPELFTNAQKKLDTVCFASPISAQGMLIFGAISSAWALRLGNFRSFKK